MFTAQASRRSMAPVAVATNMLVNTTWTSTSFSHNTGVAVSLVVRRQNGDIVDVLVTRFSPRAMSRNLLLISASVVGIPLSRRTCSKSTVGFSFIIHTGADRAEIVGVGGDVQARGAFFRDDHGARNEPFVTLD